MRDTSGFVVLVTRDNLANLAAQAARAAGCPAPHGATVLWMPDGSALVIGLADSA